MRTLLIIISLLLLGCNSDTDPSIGTWVNTGNPKFKCKILENTFSVLDYENRNDFIQGENASLIWYDYRILKKKEFVSKYKTIFYAVQAANSDEPLLMFSQIDPKGTIRLSYRTPLPILWGTKEETKKFWKTILPSLKKAISRPLRNSSVHIKQKEYNELVKLPVLGTITPEYYITLLEKSISYVDSNGMLNSYGYSGFRLHEGVFCRVLIKEGYNPFESIDKIYKFEESYFEFGTNNWGEKRDSTLKSKPQYKKINNLREILWSKTHK